MIDILVLSETAERLGKAGELRDLLRWLVRDGGPATKYWDNYSEGRGPLANRVWTASKCYIHYLAKREAKAFAMAATQHMSQGEPCNRKWVETWEKTQSRVEYELHTRLREKLISILARG